MKLGGIFRRSGTGLSVYMTDRFVRVLELGRNKKPVFEPIEIFWEQDDEGSKRQILSRVVETNGLKGKEVISCIGANEGILKFQKFPVAMSKKDLMEAIDWFIKSETQQIKEETVYDFFFLEREPEDKYIKVVITIARKSSVDRLRDTLRSAGLQPKVIDYEIVDIINYGLYNRLPPPFAILYMDYYESVLTYYGKNTITYNKIDFNYKYYRDVKDTSMLDHFLIEVRNQLVINEISNIYLAGPVIGDETTLENIMMNLPVLGILDLEDVPPAFFIPYILSIRGLEE
ncbi:MAG: pilus assembly protein PilM [Aquificota bacterium]|nr:pilus assembly protein PilM [Aquificota bacterium]